ncbi:hypothetical protein [Jeotgalicoccus sp. WY2]|uniref:hypothetical protein n=1 Tax=Jeotgalicoccus sp. WY2 TaxID=2708346 RepID=UPI00201FC688|nr:hypothetical protein [Jeotgalicoccus sp. WY2]
MPGTRINPDRDEQEISRGIRYAGAVLSANIPGRKQSVTMQLDRARAADEPDRALQPRPECE